MLRGIDWRRWPVQLIGLNRISKKICCPQFRRVALTKEQVDGYELPTAPPKKSDSRSKKWKGETCQLQGP